MWLFSIILLDFFFKELFLIMLFLLHESQLMGILTWSVDGYLNLISWWYLNLILIWWSKKNGGIKIAYYNSCYEWIWILVFNANFSYIMVTRFSGGGSRSTRKEPPTLGKQLVIFITCGCESSAPFFVIYKAGCEPTPYWW